MALHLAEKVGNSGTASSFRRYGLIGGAVAGVLALILLIIRQARDEGWDEAIVVLALGVVGVAGVLGWRLLAELERRGRAEQAAQENDARSRVRA
jgi:hypothetical protein